MIICAVPKQDFDMHKLLRTPFYLAFAAAMLAGIGTTATLIAGYSIVVVGIGMLFFFAGVLWGRSEVLLQVIQSSRDSDFADQRPDSPE